MIYYKIIELFIKISLSNIIMRRLRRWLQCNIVVEKININIPDGYGDIKDIVFSAHIIVRYNNGHCGGIDPHIIGLCKSRSEGCLYILF